MARNFILDLKDACDEQGWKFRAKGEGWLFSPPRERARPGFEVVYASDPGHDAHTRRCIVDRMRKAGLKFDDYNGAAPMATTTLPRSIGAAHDVARVAPVEPVGESLFAQLRGKINIAITALADIERIMTTIEADSTEMRKLRELLRSTLGT